MASANVTNTYVVPAATKVSPYYDDFSEDKNFYRHLFRPGHGIQARELTQIQTMLQNQIERFGRHVFVNGSPVIGGDIFFPADSFSVINLSPTYVGTEINVDQFKDKTVVLGNGDSNVVFRVIQTSQATDTDPPALYGKYISNDVFHDNTYLKIDGENVFANVASANSSTVSRIAFLRDSIFFYDGYFVKVPAQSVVISKGSVQSSARVGLQLNDAIVTEATDSSLLDPAQEASNYQAPGAARYKMDLELSYRPLNSTDDSKFIELMRVESGQIVKQIKFPVYSEIEEVLARRTYDESGNYTVKPFVIRFENDKYDADNFITSKLSPGKAYVYGYEFESVSDTRLRIPKAKTTKSVNNYNLNANYGNYVIVDNLNGVFDVSTCAMFDIHCVPQANVAYSSNAAYQTTRIGTGRVRDFDFYGGDIDVTARKYEFYLFDTNYRTISDNVLSIASNTMTLYGGSSLLSAVDDAYKGATLKITGGPGKGYTYKVATSNGLNRVLTVEGAFSETPMANSNVALSFDFSLAESFVVSSNYTYPSTSRNANCNITTLSKVDNLASGDVFISEPSLNYLVFPAADQYVANGISDISYSFRKVYDSIQFTTGTSSTILAGTGQQFLGATSSSNISESSMDNFTVIITNAQSSGRTVGEQVKVTTSVTSNSEQAVLTSGVGASNTFIATVFAKMDLATGVTPRTKTLVPSNIVTLSSDAATVLTGPSGSTANVYINSAQVLIYNPAQTPDVSESLYVSDVLGIDKIYDLNGQDVPAAGSPITQFNDVTNRYILDNGQRATHYDHASIKLKAGNLPAKGPLIVCFYYYSHSAATSGGFFSVDSYPNLASVVNSGVHDLGYGYDIIPTFTKPNGEVLELRDCIDFRPTRTNASNTFPGYTMFGAKTPLPTTDFQMDYSYYLGRRDLIVLTSDRMIDRVEGIPAKYPQEPTIPNRCMVLYSLGIPPWTGDPDKVKVKYVENKRYTMRDIGKIEKRVENLEYYVSLNTLEKSAVNQSILDVNGLERTKYGIFVDDFVGHGLGAFNLPDYKCAMNFANGYMQCESTTTGIPLSLHQARTSPANSVVVYRDKTLLAHTETVFVSQPFATKDIPVSEFLYAVFDGNIITLPEADIWKDTTMDPTIIVTDKDTVEYTTLNVYQTIVNSQSRI